MNSFGGNYAGSGLHETESTPGEPTETETGPVGGEGDSSEVVQVGNDTPEENTEGVPPAPEGSPDAPTEPSEDAPEGDDDDAPAEDQDPVPVNRSLVASELQKEASAHAYEAPFANSQIAAIAAQGAEAVEADKAADAAQHEKLQAEHEAELKAAEEAGVVAPVIPAQLSQNP